MSIYDVSVMLVVQIGGSLFVFSNLLIHFCFVYFLVVSQVEKG